MRIRMMQRNIETPLPEIQSNQPEWLFLSKMIQGSDTFIFSEYFPFHKNLEKPEDYIYESVKAVQWLKRLSQIFSDTIIIGGSVLLKDNNSKIKNTSVVFYSGKEITRYEKRRLFGKEINQIEAGDKNTFFEHPKDSSVWGILICADVFIENIFKEYEKADYIAIPTSSPYRPDDNLEEQEKRDHSIFQNGAALSDAILFKTCSVGSVGKKALDGSESPRLQGRSLISDKNNILLKAPNIHWEGVMEYDVQSTKVKEFDFIR